MSLLVNSRVRIIKDKITFITRSLKGDGEILVKEGQMVNPSDIIGRSVFFAGFRSLNLANALQVSPAEVKKYLQRQVGKPIFKGELLAYKKGGLFGGDKLVTAPTDGILELLNETTGALKLMILPSKVDLPAAVFGQVQKVDHIKKEVLIKTQVSEIYGVLGSGRMREGYLRILGDRGDLLDKGRMASDFADKILVGGGLIYPDALNKAVAVGISGIITGGINAPEFKSVAGGHLKNTANLNSDVGLGIVVTEGFGLIAIGQDIFELLKKFEDKFVIIEGNKAKISLPSYTADCLDKIRLFQLPAGGKIAENQVQVEAIQLKIGQLVRIVGSPYMGETGRVQALDQAPTKLESGISVFMITLETPSRKIKVPGNNVEAIIE